MKLEILYEDNHLLAVNKPAGALVHGDETGDETLADMVKLYIKEKYGKPGEVYLGTIHRLDRPVSGATIFARTSKALERMNRLFLEREIGKTYLAIVQSRPEQLAGHLESYLWKDSKRNMVFAIKRPSRRHADAKKAELDFELVAEINSNFLLKINPSTGRPHQIRVQLASIGCPIKGDLKYGAKSANNGGFIHLHCVRLTFMHPVKGEMVEINAPFPKEPTWNWFRQVAVEMGYK
jgi:23S rRNA pseudouridine1911/1915/1917 synthase